MAPAQSIPSTYAWGPLFDMQRRLGAASVSTTANDQLQIVRSVSEHAYSYFPWSFTLVQSPLGSIQAQNMVQDYLAPDDLYRLTRAWFYVRTQVSSGAYATGTVPPYDDPSYAAYQAAVISANYVGSEASGGTPIAYIWPPSGSLNIVKRLAPRLYPVSYPSVRSVTQQPNQKIIRLDSAVAVSSSQPFSLELEYQPFRSPINAMTEMCWFPDAYVSMAQEGILYYLYRYNNDPRAGQASYSSSGDVAYSGQLATWMAALRSAAIAEREGTVDTISPVSSLGSDSYSENWWTV